MFISIQPTKFKSDNYILPIMQEILVRFSHAHLHQLPSSIFLTNCVMFWIKILIKSSQALFSSYFGLIHSCFTKTCDPCGKVKHAVLCGSSYFVHCSLCHLRHKEELLCMWSNVCFIILCYFK